LYPRSNTEVSEFRTANVLLSVPIIPCMPYAGNTAIPEEPLTSEAYIVNI
jgi:hypothetical protein